MWLLAIAVALVVIAVACGGGNMPAATSPNTTQSVTPSTTQVVTNVGDAAADRVLSLEVTITSIVLTNANGSTATAFSGTRRIEVTHLSGTFEPFALAPVAQGTYTKADITVTVPEVVFLGSGNMIQKKEDKTFTRTVTVTFNPALVVGTAPSVLNIDLNAAASLTIDPTTNSVTFNPTFTISTNTVADNQQRDPENGELDHIVGSVSSIDTANSQFTITSGQTNLPLTFKVDSSTKFEINDSNSATLASLATGMLVRVEGVAQTNGVMLAKEVEATVTGASASEAEGLVTSVTGNPVTKFTLIVHDGNGSGIVGGMVNTTPVLGSSISVSVASNTNFVVDAGGLTIDTSTLPFDASHFSVGQRVEADSESQVSSNDTVKADDNSTSPPAGLLTASKVKLQQQALVGTVSAASPVAGGTQFTLTVSPDSAFALLTGQTTVTVVTQSATEFKNGVSLAALTPTTSVRVRGLVFWTGSAYRMAASRITTP